MLIGQIAPVLSCWHVLVSRTHSHVRHGTTSLFAALDVASGFVIGKCYKRHRAVEFLKRGSPAGLTIMSIFTPTSASWINQVERWFAELTRKQIQRGVHTSVKQLEADIRTFIDLHNRNPKPFKWTKSADQILASVKRFRHKAQQPLCGELWIHVTVC